MVRPSDRWHGHQRRAGMVIIERRVGEAPTLDPVAAHADLGSCENGGGEQLDARLPGGLD